MVDAPPIPKPNEIYDAKVSPIKIDLGDDDFKEQDVLDNPEAAHRELAQTPPENQTEAMQQPKE